MRDVTVGFAYAVVTSTNLIKVSHGYHMSVMGSAYLSHSETLVLEVLIQHVFP